MAMQKYHYKGFWLPLRGWAKRLKIDTPILRARLKAGWSVKKAFETRVTAAERRECKAFHAKRKAEWKSEAKVYEYKGERMTVNEWARKLDCPSVTIYARLRKGYSIGQALGLEKIKFDYSYRCKKLTYKGETLTTKEWAKKLHLRMNTFYQRFKKGLPEDEIFAENLYTRYKRIRKAKGVLSRGERQRLRRLGLPLPSKSKVSSKTQR